MNPVFSTCLKRSAFKSEGYGKKEFKQQSLAINLLFSAKGFLGTHKIIAHCSWIFLPYLTLKLDPNKKP